MVATYSQAKAYLNATADALYAFIFAYGPGAITKFAAALAAYEGDATAENAAALESARRALADLVTSESSGLRQNFVRAHIEMARAVTNAGYPGNDLDGAFDYVNQYMTGKGLFQGAGSDERIVPRNFQRGAITSPTGLAMRRLAYDQWGQPLVAGKIEDIRIEVTNGVPSPRRTFQLIGEDAGIDVFQLRGSGGRQTLNAFGRNAGAGGGVLSNHGLNPPSDAEGTALAATGCSGWTATTSPGWVVDATNVFQGAARAIRTITDNAEITQNYQPLDQNRPYLPVVAAYPTSDFVTNSRSIILNWGSKSQTFAGSGHMTAGAWNLLTPDMDLDLWPRNFDSASASRVMVHIDTASSNAVTLGLIDLVPMEAVFDGTWWAGLLDNTLPVMGAKGTVADTATTASVGKIALLEVLLFGRTLPTTGTNNIETI